MTRTKPFRIAHIALVLSFLLLNTCARNPVTGKQEIMLVSKEQEIAMGKQYHPQVLQQFGVYPDSTLQRFIRKKGQAMAQISHRPDLPWTFTIVDSPVLNAFAVPGGYIYFTRGIMAHFNNEAQFAGVLGHEIGHVTARHSASQQSKQTLAQIGLVAGMVISPELTQLSDLAGQGLQLLFLKFSREDESQSDRLGVEYSTRIGYNAKEMADFFNTLARKQQGGEVIPTFLSTHPDPGNRYENVLQLAEKWQNKLNVREPELIVDRDGYFQMIDGIVYGEDPRQGYVENGTFYHPELRFQYDVPSSWKLQNSPSQVLMVAPDQKAVMILTAKEAASVRQAAEEVIEQFKLQVVESRETSINGLPAYFVVGDATTEQNQTFRVMVHEIMYGDLAYQFIGYSQRATYDQYAGSFQNTAQSFDELRDQSKINVQPERIDIVKAPRNMSFTEAMRHFNMPSDRFEELAILNGMQLEEEIQNGKLIKVITK